MVHATPTLVRIVPQAYTNVDLEVNRVVRHAPSRDNGMGTPRSRTCGPRGIYGQFNLGILGDYNP